MERVVFKNQARVVGIGQAVLRKRQIAVFVAAVKLVADNRMANVREMYPDLMFAARVRNDPKQREGQWRGGNGTGGWRGAKEPALDEELRQRGRSAGAHAILDGDNAALVLAQRRVNQAVIFTDMAVDDGEVFFLDPAAFQDFSEFAGDIGVLGN